ncbi:MAG: PBP1A family penicillin-binding protein [Bacteroidales bacterium]|nr:PBP1A family penicillin-binding protein [Bacteroidales bacterium]MBR6929778.1 PBP1A family penicillin-binding protein [Bacteroidales bacterium]
MNYKKKTKPIKSNAIRNLWIIFGSMLLLLILFFFCVAKGVFGTMPSFEELENPRTNLATEIISADGKILGTYYVENRSNVRYSELSPYMPEALISIEDERFTEHSGIDEKALFRVAFGVLTGNKKGGGSTITQQLAKNLFPRGENLSKPKLVLRKFQEWITATKLEHNYSKEEIIAMYLNTVAFGHNAYGIRAAASTFFDKKPIEMNIEECALMAGVVNAPTRYSPVRNPESSKGRRNLVLRKMAENGFITQAECDSISQIPLDMSHFSIKDHNSGQATYFREFLRGELNEWAKNTTRADGTPYNIYRDGLRIYTTIDSRMQKYAEDAVKEFMGKELQPMFYSHWKGYRNAPFSNLTADEIDHILETAMKRTDRYRNLKNEGVPIDSIKAEFKRPVPMTVFSWKGPIDTVMTPMDSIRYYKWFLQASLISIESHTGHVKAYVGGLDYRFFKYDHVTQARRQVGSTFKPFLYSLAMQEGEFTPCTRIPNIPYNIQLEDGKFWSPGNAGGHVGEEITLKFALAQSNNWVSAYLMNRFGPNAVIAQARRMGVESPIDAVPAICLGVCDLKLIEMVGAMSTFANQGVYIKPMFITRIEDKNGNVIQRFSSEESEAMSEVTAYKMVELMKGVVQSGTGIRLRSTYGFTNPIAGKTGTTQKNSDGYFMGITPDLTTGVWVGAEDRSVHFRSTKLGQGSHTALPIWAMYMKKVYADKSLNISKGDFAKPYAPGIDLNFDCNRYDDEESIESIDEF